MHKLILLFLITISGVSSLQAQTEKAAKCNCNKYPFKPNASCFDYCVKQLLGKNDFKKLITRSRLSADGQQKLQNWSQDSLNDQSLNSILNERDMAKVEASLQSYYDNPDNIQRSTSPFMQSFGSTISVLFGKDSRYSSNVTLSQTSVAYFPRYNLTQGDNSSVSIGAPVAIGIGIASNTIGNDVGIAFSYDLPVVLDYNFGCKSSRKTEKTFGGYVGAGFGYYHTSISQSAYSDFTGATYGPMGRLGVRFSKESWGDKAVTIGVFYKKGLEKSKFQTIGFNVFYDF